MIERLASDHRLNASQMGELLRSATQDLNVLQLLRDNAVRTAREQFGLGIYIRGLVELSSYCYQDCLYCGLRRSNKGAERYRLTQEEVMKCAEEGYKLGFRTIVLQGGEDGTHTDKWLEELIHNIPRCCDNTIARGALAQVVRTTEESRCQPLPATPRGGKQRAI